MRSENIPNINIARRNRDIKKELLVNSVKNIDIDNIIKKNIPPLRGVFLLYIDLCDCPCGLSIKIKYLLWINIIATKRTDIDINKINIFDLW